jgi:hypothetical protein
MPPTQVLNINLSRDGSESVNTVPSNALGSIVSRSNPNADKGSERIADEDCATESETESDREALCRSRQKQRQKQNNAVLTPHAKSAHNRTHARDRSPEAADAE